MQKTIKRGQVWFYEPTVTPSGHIQKGSRPVIIVSNDKLNDTSSVVLAVPCTTQIKRNFPTHVLFIMNGKVSVALAEQVMPVNVDELTNVNYILEDYMMESVDEALRISLGFIPSPSNVTPRIGNNYCSTEDNAVEDIDNLEAPQKKPIGHQIDKFYKKYPQLKSKSKSGRNIWTKEKIDALIFDYNNSSNHEEVARKWNVSTKTLLRYYYKFRPLVEDLDKEA